MKRINFFSLYKSIVFSIFVITCLLYLVTGTSPVRANQEWSHLQSDLATPIIQGCPIFPANNIWNTRVDNLPIHTNSSQWIDTIGRTTGFHMDFGSGVWDGGPIGIPYNIVDESVTKISVPFYYDDQSDVGPYPIPTNPLIEYGSDHHLLILDHSTCTLYEIYGASYSAGAWHGMSGAIWSLNSNALRPDTWTSADAAGLPILPGLVRYDEIVSGEINHAIRFTAAQTNGYIWPARHLTSNDPGAPQIPPMGARFRLKASFDITGYPSQMQIILRTMKKYGIILADNGSDWYVSGAPDVHWDNDMLHSLDDLTGDAFEAVDVSSLMIDPNSGEARLRSTAAADFNGDGKTDISIFRPSNGLWAIKDQGYWVHGMAGDIPVSAAYNGDGITDIAIFRPSNGLWAVKDQGYWVHGMAGDIPVPGDYNVDGRTDMAVFRKGIWFIYGQGGVSFGMAGDVPVPGDYKGDGRTDMAIFRPSTGLWTVNGIGYFVYGMNGDIPVPGDYNGDGATDIAVYRPSNGLWFIYGQGWISYGMAGDKPVPGDYNGDGKTEVAIFRPSNGLWAINGVGYLIYGMNGDIPIPAPNR